jgi:hypothetical protein
MSENNINKYKATIEYGPRVLGRSLNNTYTKMECIYELPSNSYLRVEEKKCNNDTVTKYVFMVSTVIKIDLMELDEYEVITLHKPYKVKRTNVVEHKEPLSEIVFIYEIVVEDTHTSEEQKYFFNVPKSEIQTKESLIRNIIIEDENPIGYKVEITNIELEKL